MGFCFLLSAYNYFNFVADLSPFKIRRAVSTEGQASLCLSTGRHQDGLRNKIELKECSANGILREFFTFDKRGRLRSLRYKKYCVEPMKSTTGFSQIQMQKCSTSKTSWFLDSKGHFLANGSKAALTVSMIEGNVKNPFLSSLIEENENVTQEWNRIHRD